jgi:hypothetical protein
MAQGLDPRITDELSGPKHGYAAPGGVSEPVRELDEILGGASEISALEHAIRMAPADWTFESDEPEISF